MASYWLVSTLALLALCASLWALWLSAYPRIDQASTKSLRAMELELVELQDTVAQQIVTLKKLTARSNARKARAENNPEDQENPFARRDGESGDSWKARVGTMLMNRRPM